MELDSSAAHYNLGVCFDDVGDLKKAKFHYEAAATAGHEGARLNLRTMESLSGKMGRAIKHCTIAASAGNRYAMHNFLLYSIKVLSAENQSTQL